MPAAVTLSIACWPGLMVVPSGCCVIAGGHGGVTVTMATALSTDVLQAVTRTQYVVVVVGDGLYVAPVLGPGAFGPLGGVPVCHWYVGFVPLATTVRLAAAPKAMVWSCGCVEIVGAVQVPAGLGL